MSSIKPDIMKSRHQETSVSTMNIQKRLKWCRYHEGWYRLMEASDILWRVQILSFSNWRASLCVEAAQGSLQPWLLSSHSETL